MKTLIIALNSKYIHASLAPWYLKAVCGEKYGEIKVLEYTVNDSMDSILASIYREKADVAAFSCYIWNITQVLRIAEDVRKLQPNIKIILGGPEASFDASSMMESNPAVDFIVSGEGEIPFERLIASLYEGIYDVEEIEGITFRKSGKVLSSHPCRFIDNLDSIPSPYTAEMLAAAGNRIVYFESSRGCPFSCSYCISSTFEGVRYFSLERVKSDLHKLIRAGVRQIKFVDRTFNCHRERAKEIFKFIIGLASSGIHPEETRKELSSYPAARVSCPEPARVLPNFHFEAAADLYDDEMLDILSQAPGGLIQFEIGIQTTNLKTLELINRKTSLERVFENVNRLNRLGNIHLHLDLIAGLPEEDSLSFKKSFNDVYGLKPHQLQLGFLKMLKGARIRGEAEKYGYSYRSSPPYEILGNRYLSFDEILALKDVEEMVERYYNSGRFSNTLEYAISSFHNSPFAFYSSLSTYFRDNGYFQRALSAREGYTVLNEYLKTIVPADSQPVVNELLKLDFLSSDNTNNLPAGIYRHTERGFQDQCFMFLKNADHVRTYLPMFEGLSAKQIFKSVHFEVFDLNLFEESQKKDFKREKTVVLFNYAERDKVTGLYKYTKVSLW